MIDGDGGGGKSADTNVTACVTSGSRALEDEVELVERDQIRQGSTGKD
jgi:hypothetical protein